MASVPLLLPELAAGQRTSCNTSLSMQAKELLDHLEGVLANEPVEVVPGQSIVEVKPQARAAAAATNLASAGRCCCWLLLAAAAAASAAATEAARLRTRPPPPCCCCRACPRAAWWSA